MIAYEPGANIAYEPMLTGMSLGVAIGGSGLAREQDAHGGDDRQRRARGALGQLGGLEAWLGAGRGGCDAARGPGRRWLPGGGGTAAR
jgi:hypothetical protein